MSFRIIYIMGVSGSGKTTIGKLLSAITGYAFYDADDFHPKKNIDKMKAGLPLTGKDREPWLSNLHDLAAEKTKKSNIIIACSALKKIYRDQLSKGIEQDCRWVFLNGNYETISHRIKNRSGHYMPASLLQSQFDELELPVNAIEVDINLTPETIAAEIISKI